jgi:hypothetical protein
MHGHRSATRSSRTIRAAAITGVVVFLAASCGGGAKVSDSGGGGNGSGGGSSNTSTTTPTSDACAGKSLQSSEVGIDASTIHIGVIADVGSPIRPGLFQGSIDGINAWAKYKNANGGLACRKVVVDDYDSKLDPDDAKNSLLSTCTGDLAAVGTTATFINDTSPLTDCKDKAGATTGLPDIATLETTYQEQCNATSYTPLATGGSCPYTGSGERTYDVSSGPFEYYLKKFGKNSLHGVWVIPKDLPSTIASSMPGFREEQALGIKKDAELGASGLDTQSAYTPIVQTIKNDNSTYARNGLDYKGTVFSRKEAQIQGVTSVKVWDCSVQCYDQRLITEGGSAVEDQYTWLTFLPFEDKGSNATLDNFLKYDTKPDGFGAQAWASAELFAQVVDNIVKDKGPNAITRAGILDGLKSTHKFDAGGMIPPVDIGARTGTVCYVLMQVKNQKFVRVNPTKPGTFDCTGQDEKITLDPVKAFQG